MCAAAPSTGAAYSPAATSPAGTRIGRYGGQRFVHEDEHRGRDRSGLTYLFALSDGSYIDGAHGGNATRFINHSCAPNCMALEIEAGGRLSVVIESLRPIGRGEELLLDYSLEIPESDVNLYECGCGTDTCRGTMAAANPTMGDAR